MSAQSPALYAQAGYRGGEDASNFGDVQIDGLQQSILSVSVLDQPRVLRHHDQR